MTLKSKLITIIGIALTLVVVAWVSAYLILNNTYNRGEKEVRIVVPRGATLGQITDSLYARGVIYNKTSFKLAAWLSGKTRQLYPGAYYLPPNLTNKALLSRLTTVQLQEETITIPEGLRSDEIISILSKQLELDSTELSELMTDSTLLAVVDHGFTHLEGTLFPDTYRFIKGETPRATLERLLRHFNTQLRPEWLDRAEELGMTIPEVITLASLVEKETANPAERHLIAGVYHNRLRQRMLLNCDPTLIYALVQMGQWDGNLKLEHKKMRNPYNTYRYRGLPPTPIANPGSASIEAALYPEETEYLYFVGISDGSGKHIFSKTLREHINNVNRYQRRGR